MKKVFKATRRDQYVQPVEFDPGRYTFHAVVKGEVYSFALKTENGVWLSFDLSWQLEDGEWSRITHTFDLTEKCVEFSLFASETTSEVLIGDPMFEEGDNRSTPSVSPLDLDEVSENISERVTVNFDVLDDRIQANVIAITNAVDDISGITTRVSEAESEISVQAGIIEQKADKTEVTALGTTVTSLGLIVDAHTGQIASKVSQTEYNEFGDQVSNQFSQINQRAGEIEISVSSLDEKVDENKGLSEAYADSVAASAESAAKSYAEAQALWAKTEAGSYTDGEITTLNNQLLDTGINIQQQLITITADNTIFRDNQGNPIALFNLSWTKIQASAIELEGLVTVNSKFKVLLDGSIEAVDGKFTGQITANEGSLGALTMQSGGYIDLPPTFTDRKGRLDNTGLQLVYDGNNSQKIEWYSGLGTHAGQITCNSGGRLQLTSDFGVDIATTINNAISITPSGFRHSINFNTSVLFGVSALNELGLLNLAYTTHALSGSTNYNLSSDTTLVVLTSVGENAGIYRMTVSGNTPSNGDVRIILNASSSQSCILKSDVVNSNIRIILGGGPWFRVLPGSIVFLVYYGGYWMVQTDYGQPG